LKACGSRWTGTGETTPGGGPERVPTSGATTRKTTEAYRQTPSLDSVRILVTGAGGQLGRELIEVLASHEVHCRDHRGLDIVDGGSKYAGELQVQSADPSAYVLRTAWLYGEYGKNFVEAILKAAERGGPLKVVADQVGSPTWTRHLAQAIGELIQTPARGLFHVANAGACSRFEFARAIVQGRVEVQPISATDAARPAPRPANSALDSARWQAAGLRPLPAWESALADYLGEDGRRR